MIKVEETIKQGQKDALEKLRLYNGSDSLSPILLLTSYCGDDNPNCTDTKPCDKCLKMCNIAFIEKDAIELEKVVCGFDFVDEEIKKDEPVIFKVKLSLNKLNELNEGKFIGDDGGLDIARTKLATMLMDLGFNYVHVINSELQSTIEVSEQ